MNPVLLSKSAKWKLSLCGLLGIVACIYTIMLSLNLTDWKALVLHILYAICYIWICSYILVGLLTSHGFYRNIIITYVLTVLWRDIVFPPEGLPGGLEIFAGLLAMLEIAGLLILNTEWKRFSRVKGTMLLVVIFDCVISAIWTINCINGGPTLVSLPFTVLGLWMRPVIALCIYACYVARMNVKLKCTCSQ